MPTSIIALSTEELRDIVTAAVVAAKGAMQASSSLEKRWLTPDQCSDYTGISTQQLALWRMEQQAIPFVKFGRLIRYDRLEVDQFMASGHVRLLKKEMAS